MVTPGSFLADSAVHGSFFPAPALARVRLPD